ncbi:GNAT family N-acetyltransferase [Desulfovibrio litoralis]|uniref:N-acetyltransferase domain-containing protein n=1 Tax=Desulfovibrio litoralis DSM 11393 TaxID=1121455 RepID=A0A1M7TN56_9BACT|nr:GNAT family N-acetyltransferase [Desulfovibrio litoralis]SHN72172.1 hypothetical protein SAMN02745728_02293 [Desulfovibrio litoralis DSM 11393]
MLIRKIENSEISKIYAHMINDFPPSERPPFEIIEQSLVSGTQKCFIGVKDNEEIGYAMCADAHPNNFVLLNFFAVFQEHRERKFGTAFLQQLFELYKNKAGMFIETETPLCANSSVEEKLIFRRQKFYEKLGVKTFYDLEYSLFDVPMYLNIYPLQKDFAEIKKVASTAITELWRDIVGEEKMHNIIIKAKNIRQ